MRVLMTTDTIGGVWTFTQELSRELLSQGHEVALVSFGREPSPKQRAWSGFMRRRHGDAFLYRDSSVPLEWMSDNRAAYIRGEKVLLDVASRFEPEVMHLNQYCFGRLPLPIPRIITAHSDVLSWADACRPAGLEESEWLNCYCELVQEGLEGADCVLAPTSSMLQALCAHFDVRCPVRVVNNGRSIPPAIQMPERQLRAISAGRLWDEAKGLSTLLHLHSPMPVLIAGEESFDGKSVPAPAKLELLGMLDPSALFDAFRASSIYIAASRYEPFGLAPLEAALCGCAIVARDIPSLREVWGEDAAYFEDAPHLERLLRLLAEDHVSLQQAQLAATRRARQYSVEEMTAAYAAIYLGCIEGFESQVGNESGEYVSHAA